ncbi:MAG: class-III pyridoxal-phosphate-dependent aminotransferase [Promethearchaeota archaeon]
MNEQPIRKDELKIIGAIDQKSIIKMYSKYVNYAKASFFKSLGIGVVQGKRNGVFLNTLEGPRKSQPPFEWIDCRTSGGVFNLGHANPAMINALKEALDAGLDIGDHHLISEQRAFLAKELIELMPGDISKLQYSVGGGEAIDLALKLAFATTKRKKVISASVGYHGVTGLALAAGNSKFKDPFLWNLPGFEHVEFGNIEDLKKKINEDTAAVIFETIPATGGILIAPEGYFAEVRELCDKFGVVMIQDEVQTGLGRIGELWGIYGGLYKNEKIVPDIMVLAKGMTGGLYPIAVTCYKKYLDEVFKEDPFLHISTTGGAELGCYVARKMLSIQSKEEFLQHVREMGQLFKKGLEEIKENYPHLVKEVRGRGLMWGIEFTNERYSLGCTLLMIQNGVLADYCGNKEDTIKLMPPLIIKKEEIEELLNRLNIIFDKMPKEKKE